MKNKSFKLEKEIDDALREASKNSGQKINFIIKQGILLAINKIKENGYITNDKQKSSISNWGNK